MSNTSISTTGLNRLLQSALSPVIIGVRKKPAFDKAPDTLPGTIWRNHEEANIRAKNLRESGFDICFLGGGIDAWKQTGLPLAKSSE